MAVAYLAGTSPTELRDLLAADVPWETYATARLISEKDLSLLRRFDKRDASARASMMQEAGHAYLGAHVAVLRGVTKNETCKYVLASLIELLQESPDRATGFVDPSLGDAAVGNSHDVFGVLLRLLSRDDWQTQEMAARVLTAALDFRPKKSSAFANGVLAGDPDAETMAAVYGGLDPVEPHISTFVDWLVAQLRRPSSPTRSVPLAASCLSALLKERGSRMLLHRAGGAPLLPPLLKASNLPTNTQLLYELALCAWQMTFVEDAAAAMARAGIVRALSDVARTAQKEKVFRVSALALRNLLTSARLSLAGEMAEAGLPKTVATRQLQNWGDEDIVDLLAFLDERLRAGIRALSSFDVYKAEVLRGALDWTPMHTSDVFWRENVEKFEDKDFAVLRALLALLQDSREPKTIAVACSDIGHFVSHHASGRFIVNQLHGKELVMRHMASSDPEVQKQALLCVQKLMLTKEKLEFLRPQ
mmetsp:Transcript_20117/g.59739  ORF Transcript_20117/g.59739 Transcript_20117/m.59739 type:complete len:476 (-) Transcript_20117:197-1624(-)